MFGKWKPTFHSFKSGFHRYISVVVLQISSLLESEVSLFYIQRVVKKKQTNKQKDIKHHLHLLTFFLLKPILASHDVISNYLKNDTINNARQVIILWISNEMCTYLINFANIPLEICCVKARCAYGHGYRWRNFAHWWIYAVVRTRLGAHT